MARVIISLDRSSDDSSSCDNNDDDSLFQDDEDEYYGFDDDSDLRWDDDDSYSDDSSSYSEEDENGMVLFHVQQETSPSKMCMVGFDGDLETVKEILSSTTTADERSALLNGAHHWTEYRTPASSDTHKERETTQWFGLTPVAVAALNGQGHVVKYLLEQGADPTLQGFLSHLDHDVEMSAFDCASKHFFDVKESIETVINRRKGREKFLPKSDSNPLEKAKEMVLDMEKARHCCQVLQAAFPFWEDAPYKGCDYSETARKTYSNKPKDQGSLMKALRSVRKPYQDADAIMTSSHQPSLRGIVLRLSTQLFRLCKELGHEFDSGEAKGPSKKAKEATPAETSVATTSDPLSMVYECSRCHESSRKFSKGAMKRITQKGSQTEICLACTEKEKPTPLVEIPKGDRTYKCKACHKYSRDFGAKALKRLEKGGAGQSETCSACANTKSQGEVVKNEEVSPPQLKCHCCQAVTYNFDSTNLEKAKTREPVYCIPCVEAANKPKVETEKEDEQLPRAYECTRCHTRSRNFSKNAMKRNRKGSTDELCLACVEHFKEEKKSRNQRLFACKECLKSSRNYGSNALKRLGHGGKAECCLDCISKPSEFECSSCHVVSRNFGSVNLERAKSGRPARCRICVQTSAEKENTKNAKAASTSAPPKKKNQTSFECSKCHEITSRFSKAALERLEAGKLAMCVTCFSSKAGLTKQVKKKRIRRRAKKAGVKSPLQNVSNEEVSK